MNTYRAGTYLRCEACGRLLRIDWPTRSIVCSCGQRLPPPPAEAHTPAPPSVKKKPEAPR